MRDRKRLGTQRILECGHFESTKSCYKCQGMEKHIQTLLSCFFLLKRHVACQCIVNAQVKVYNYPLFRRCDCPAKLRATHHIRQVTMECARMHTVTSHKNDKSKYSHTIDGMQFIQRIPLLQWNVKNVMGDEHKGIIKWTGDICVKHCLCFVQKSDEILSKSVRKSDPGSSL